VEEHGEGETECQKVDALVEKIDASDAKIEVIEQMAENDRPDNCVDCPNFMAAQISKAFPGALLKQMDRR
jgi:hypothetical protein